MMTLPLVQHFCSAYLLFLLSSFIHTNSQTVTKKVTLTPANILVDGARLIYNINEVQAISEAWIVKIFSHNSWQFIISLDSTYGFHALSRSVTSITMSASSLSTSEILFGFTTDDKHYVSMSIPMDNLGRTNRIYPSCIPSLRSTQSFAVGEIASAPDFNRKCDIAGGDCANWRNMIPSNHVYDAGMPITVRFEHFPENNLLEIYFEDSSTRGIVQRCTFASGYTTGTGLKVYVAGGNPAETFIVSSFDVSSTTYHPTSQPTQEPTDEPTQSPTKAPSTDPTQDPTQSPSFNPTQTPTQQPSQSPTKLPSTDPTQNPTLSPSFNPTKTPTQQPTKTPTISPSTDPTPNPTQSPSFTPTRAPSEQPTAPTLNPTAEPTKTPTSAPTDTSQSPSLSPTGSPTLPTVNPTKTPTNVPTTTPTDVTETPTQTPTKTPTNVPTDISQHPTQTPTTEPTNKPTDVTQQPTETPTKGPTNTPTDITQAPTKSPSDTPTNVPTDISQSPSASPTGTPTLSTENPTETPTHIPTQGTIMPSTTPSKIPTSTPIIKPVEAGFMWGAFDQLCPGHVAVTGYCKATTDVYHSSNINCLPAFSCCMCSSIECGFEGTPCVRFIAGTAGVYGVKHILVAGDTIGAAGATIDCQGAGSCEATSINASSVGFLDCDGDHSCQNATIMITDPKENFALECSGVDSCNGLKIEINLSPSECRYVLETVFSINKIICNAERSCEGLHLTVNNAGCDKVVIETFECMKPNACDGAVFNFIGDIEIGTCKCGPSCSNALGLEQCFFGLEFQLCSDPLACAFQTQTIINPRNAFEFVCSDVSSCEGGNFIIIITPDIGKPVTSLGKFIFGGEDAAKDATFTIDNQQGILMSLQLIECGGQNSCVGTTFVLGSNVFVDNIICAWGACTGCLIQRTVDAPVLPCDPTSF